MKLIRFGEPGKEKHGVIIDYTLLDLSDFVKDFNEDFFENDGLTALASIIEKEKEELKVIDKDVRLGAPVARPSKIICIGLNYAKHAKETNAPLPKEPILFFKSTTAVTGPFENIIIPKNSVKTNWEGKLPVAMAKKQSH